MDLWSKVKNQARILGKANDWPFIMQLYRSRGGMSKSIVVFVNAQQCELQGENDDGMPIVKSQDGVVFMMEKDDYLKCKKTFGNK